MSGQGREGARRVRAVATCLMAAGLLLAVLAAYKLLPGQLSHAQSMIGDAAYAQCLHDTRASGENGCKSFGWPHGAPRPFGLPVSLAADAVFAGDGRVTPGEVRTIYAGVVVLAFLLAAMLFRRVAGTWPLGILGAGLYLLAPVVQLQSSFAALQLGFALIPGYLLFDLMLLDAMRHGRRGRAVLLVGVVAGTRILAVFLDGYSFLFAAALSAACLLLAVLRPGPGSRLPAGIAMAAHVACTGLAAWMYGRYTPGELGVMPVDFFRGAGVDVLTMLLPMQWQGLYGVFGLGLDIQPEMSYGGRASLLGMFLGYSSLLACGVLAWAVARRRVPRPGVPAAGIMLAGAVAVLLSLGPSLKFNDFRDDHTRTSALGFSAYLMPEEAATLSLHSGWIYQKVPGVRNARVLGRWQVLARLALVTVVLLALAGLWRMGRRWPAVALAVFALLEAVPDPRIVAEESRGASARADLVYRVHGGAFTRLVRPGERVLLMQVHEGANDNEFAADTLCALARARCYNAGGDKVAGPVAAAWPAEIRAARTRRDRGENVREAFRKDLLDVAVVPHFDLRLVVYPWAPDAVDRLQVVGAVDAMFGGGELRIEHGDGFSVIRPGAVGTATGQPPQATSASRVRAITSSRVPSTR